MGQVTITGSLEAGPPGASEAFPGMRASAPVSTRQSPKTFAVATGVLSRSVNVASPAWGVLQGVGATDTVTKGDTLYLKVDQLVFIRMTVGDGAGGQTVLDPVPVAGVFIMEFDSSSRSLELLEVQGTARIEYFVSGQQ